MNIEDYIEDARRRWVRGGGRSEDFWIWERAIRRAVAFDRTDPEGGDKDD